MIKSWEELRACREKYQRVLADQYKKVLVCGGTGCVAGGALEIHHRLQEILTEKGLPYAVEMAEEPHGPAIGLKKSGCHGFCEMGPLLRIEPYGWLYIKVKPEDCEEIVEKTLIGDEAIERLLYKKDGVVYKTQDEIPFYQKQTRVVLEHCGHIDAESIEEYIAIGGYEALAKALFTMTPEEIVNEIDESKLRGRGGAGFRVGLKWRLAAEQPGPIKYIVCNGDEGDPGAFMDRSIMEGDPHRMLEGMIIAGVAVGASEGYIYVRAEYPLATQKLRTAIEQATAKGLLGEHILGTDFSFTLHINQGAGAFVCGEGSALTASIEGERGMPRVTPPYPVEHGLFGKPTVLNNVETFANITSILIRGAGWFKGIGTAESTGTKAFALTGNVNCTGLIEVPMGTTLREVIFDIGGGIKDGRNFKAVQIGGPSGGCLIEDHPDVPLDFDSLKKMGAMIGSGGLVVMDDHTCMVEIARFFMNFTQNESCGKCVPCREGTRRMLEILERIVHGQGQEGDMELLELLGNTIIHTALCGLGKTAPTPVLSTLRHFPEEYRSHIVDKKCPAKACRDLRTIRIVPELCRGCSRCSRTCPVGAISGKLKETYTIDQSKCIKCDSCIESCKFQAIIEEA